MALAGCGGVELIPQPVETTAPAQVQDQPTLPGSLSSTALPATGPLTTLTPARTAPADLMPPTPTPLAPAETAPAQPQNQPGGMKAALNTPFNLQLNQTARITSENLGITFAQVKEDSRCPQDVECMWEGQAVVVVKIVKDGQDLGSVELTSRAGQEALAVKHLDSLAVKLVAVAPYPKSGQAIDPAAYTITLLVTPQR